MLPITSQQNPHVKLVKSLEDKKARREHGLFVAEGLNMLERAAACGWEPELYRNQTGMDLGCAQATAGI
jgi:hypothetical protein